MNNMKCKKGYEFEVMSTPAGYYVGTVCEDDGYPEPYCRASGYYNTRQDAEKALEEKTFVRYAAENEFCNGGEGCK